MERDLDSFEKNLIALRKDEIYVNLLYIWENTEKILEALGRVRSATGAKTSSNGVGRVTRREARSRATR